MFHISTCGGLKLYLGGINPPNPPVATGLVLRFPPGECRHVLTTGGAKQQMEVHVFKHIQTGRNCYFWSANHAKFTTYVRKIHMILPKTQLYTIHQTWNGKEPVTNGTSCPLHGRRPCASEIYHRSWEYWLLSLSDISRNTRASTWLSGKGSYELEAAVLNAFAWMTIVASHPQQNTGSSISDEKQHAGALAPPPGSCFGKFHCISGFRWPIESYTAAQQFCTPRTEKMAVLHYSCVHHSSASGEWTICWAQDGASGGKVTDSLRTIINNACVDHVSRQASGGFRALTRHSYVVCVTVIPHIIWAKHNLRLYGQWLRNNCCLARVQPGVIADHKTNMWLDCSLKSVVGVFRFKQWQLLCESKSKF